MRKPVESKRRIFKNKEDVNCSSQKRNYIVQQSYCKNNTYKDMYVINCVHGLFMISKNGRRNILLKYAAKQYLNY